MADILSPVFPSPASVLTSWIPGKTPMATWPAMSTAILSYLTVIYGLQEFMRDRPALKLNPLFRIHNAFLSLGSLVLLVLILEEVTKLWHSVGAYSAFCAGASWTRVKTLSFLVSNMILSDAWFQRLEFYYMLNYYFKYIEFLDTLFLVLKKRPLCKSFRYDNHHL